MLIGNKSRFAPLSVLYDFAMADFFDLNFVANLYLLIMVGMMSTRFFSQNTIYARNTTNIIKFVGFCGIFTLFIISGTTFLYP